jgi:hypothetical protein
MYLVWCFWWHFGRDVLLVNARSQFITFPSHFHSLHTLQTKMLRAVKSAPKFPFSIKCIITCKQTTLSWNWHSVYKTTGNKYMVWSWWTCSWPSRWWHSMLHQMRWADTQQNYKYLVYSYLTETCEDLVSYRRYLFSPPAVCSVATSVLALGAALYRLYCPVSFTKGRKEKPSEVNTSVHLSATWYWQLSEVNASLNLSVSWYRQLSEINTSVHLSVTWCQQLSEVNTSLNLSVAWYRQLSEINTSVHLSVTWCHQLSEVNTSVHLSVAWYWQLKHRSPQDLTQELFTNR